MKPLTLHVYKDVRGTLIPIPFADLPFEPKHMFVISEIQGPSARGKHAHREMKQILFCVQGQCQVLLTKDPDNAKIHVLHAGEFMFHDNLEWAQMFFQKEGTVLISLCDREYDETDVISDFEEFKKLVDEKNKVVESLANAVGINPSRLNLSVHSIFEGDDFVFWKEIFLDGQKTPVKWAPEIAQDFESMHLMKTTTPEHEGIVQNVILRYEEMKKAWVDWFNDNSKAHTV